MPAELTEAQRRKRKRNERHAVEQAAKRSAISIALTISSVPQTHFVNWTDEQIDAFFHGVSIVLARALANPEAG